MQPETQKNEENEHHLDHGDQVQPGERTQKLSRHEEKERERQRREEERQQAFSAEHRRKKTKKIVTWSIVLIVIGGFVWWLASSMANRMPPYTSAPVHWHALLDIEICGQPVDLPRVGAGKHHRGLPLLHTHDDNVVHVEGQPLRAEDIMLGAFMDAVGVKFGPEQIMDKSNEDRCPGTNSTGTVKMFVNDKPNTDFRNYVIKATQEGKDQVIKIVFE